MFQMKGPGPKLIQNGGMTGDLQLCATANTKSATVCLCILMYLSDVFVAKWTHTHVQQQHQHLFRRGKSVANDTANGETMTCGRPVVQRPD